MCTVQLLHRMDEAICICRTDTDLQYGVESVYLGWQNLPVLMDVSMCLYAI